MIRRAVPTEPRTNTVLLYGPGVVGGVASALVQAVHFREIYPLTCQPLPTLVVTVVSPVIRFALIPVAAAAQISALKMALVILLSSFAGRKRPHGRGFPLHPSTSSNQKGPTPPWNNPRMKACNFFRNCTILRTKEAMRCRQGLLEG